MASPRRGGAKRSFAFSTTDVHFWTTRSASNINQVGQFQLHFPAKKGASPVYYPNASTSSHDDAYLRTYESEPRRRASGYGTLPTRSTQRQVETTETTELRVYERITTHFPSGRESSQKQEERRVNGAETKKGRVDLPARHQRSEPSIPTTTFMEDRRIQKEFYRSRPDVANSSVRATSNGSAAGYHAAATAAGSSGVLAVSGFQGNETDENIEAWMREQPVALRRLDRHDRLVLKIGGLIDISMDRIQVRILSFLLPFFPLDFSFDSNDTKS
uniref:Uncharacterized protein n=1 Tax=Steinernema glaseri TaxID=37863 RepID=A0A1I7ZSH1_9BILA